VLAAGVPAEAAAAKRKQPRRPVVSVAILTLTQQDAHDSGVLRVELGTKRDATVHVRGLLREPGGQMIVAPTKVVRLRAGKRRNVALPLTEAGRARFGRDCHVLRVYVVARAHGKYPHRAATTDRSLPSLEQCPQPGGGPPPTTPPVNSPGPVFTYSIGLASRSIAPGADGKYNGGDVHLGGYGFGTGTPIGDRKPADGILADGPHVRAFSLSDGKHVFAFADIEVQGWFVANKDLPYGLVDMRKAVQAQTGGALKADQVLIQSDHTHGGADPMGVWGGVPLSFRKFMFDQTVAAIVDAWQHRTPANLYYGWAPARDLQSNQFDYDASNKVMDSDLRVLQARKSDGTPVATILDYSAHPTVLGSSNQHITGDWPQEANKLMAERFGGKALTIVGTLGRTQPADRSCPTSTKSDSDPDEAACKLDHYAGRVVDRVSQALENATLLAGPPAISAKSYLIQDPAHNAVLLGFGAVGDPIGIPLNRSLTPPWLTGNVLGTVTGSVRIGDVLLSTVPGEIYPQIALKVADSLTGPVRKHGFMTAGLANDQLGYIIYPYEAYPEPIMATFVSRGDQLPTPDPIGNDNYAFNVSHTLGARVTCSLLRGAGEAFGSGLKYRSADPECVQFPNDTLYSEGMDVSFPAP